MKLFIVYLFNFFILSYGFESIGKEYKRLDRKIANVIMKPSKKQWDKMLEVMEYFVNKLKDPGIILAQSCEKNKALINGILKDGCPNFVNLAVDKGTLLSENKITMNQLKVFYELRNDTKKTWNELVSICARQNVTLGVTYQCSD